MAQTELLTVCAWCKHPMRPDGSPIESITIQGDIGIPVSHGLCTVDQVKQRAELALVRQSRKAKSEGN